ncbi:MAG: response regulator [Archangium sp.]|nr:response regulator [Archangium sp.]
MSANGVVVVDDSPGGKETAASVARLGYQATLVTSGEACLDALAAGPLPLAVLVSLELRPMPGDECCRLVKEHQAWRGVGVIVVTSSESPHEVMRCWRAAADDFLLRPLTTASLAPKLDMLTRAAGPAGAGRRPLAGKSLLLAESSRLYRNQIGANLEQAGMRVLYATEGDEALEVALEHAAELDACLLDTVLPGLDGVTLAAKLRAGPLKHKPILLMSGSEAMNPAAQEAAQRLTGSGVLDKRTLPFEAILAKVYSTVQPSLTQLRSAERTPFFSVVDFSVDGREWFSGFAYDISAGGIFIRTLTPMQPTAEVHVKVRTAGETASAHSAGVVAWSNPYWPRSSFAAAVGMGVRLTRMAPVLANQVERLARPRTETSSSPPRPP